LDELAVALFEDGHLFFVFEEWRRREGRAWASLLRDDYIAGRRDLAGRYYDLIGRDHDLLRRHHDLARTDDGHPRHGDARLLLKVSAALVGALLHLGRAECAAGSRAAGRKRRRRNR
jgi:hypothetical protein